MALTNIERVKLNAKHLERVSDRTLQLCIDDAHEIYIKPYLSSFTGGQENSLETVERYLAIHLATLNIRRPDSESLAGMTKSISLPKDEGLSLTEYGQTAKKLASQLGLKWAMSDGLKPASVGIY